MRLSCRFILANQLKHEHLPYLVLPEKISWHLRAYKNASDIHSLLPALLQLSLESVSKKDVSTYLERLKRELKRGQFVALSISPLSSPASSVQWNSTPVLAKKSLNFKVLRHLIKKRAISRSPITPL